MRVFAVLAGLALVFGAASMTSAGSSIEERYLVGYDADDRAAAHLAVKAAGGHVERSSGDLHFAVVTTSDPATFERLATLSPAIQYVETDDPIRISGAQWNGAQWNGAQWNGAQWNGAQWNGAQWNGAQWNGAQWNGAQWNGAQWNAFNWTKRSGVENWPPAFPLPWGQTDPGLVWQWGVWETGTVDAWRTTTGTRAASVCVLDSGVAWDHPDLAPNYASGYNAIDPAASAYDDGGHGTHIAGIAAAAVGNAYGVAGVGNLSILNAKVLSGDGTGYESDLAFGLAWCAREDAEVAVMALSASEPGPTLDRALQFAADRDVLLAASAGNTGGSVQFPASDPRVIAVAATNAQGERASFSSHGPEVELAAPGVEILSTFNDGSFVFGSGTSQAVAFVAGIAALVRDHNATLAAEETRERLRATAEDLGPAGPDNATGHGLVRADQATR